MHILILTTGLPSPYEPTRGTFFLEQARALAQFRHRVALISTCPIPVQAVASRRTLEYLGNDAWDEGGVSINVRRFVSVPKMPRRSVARILAKGIRQVDEYIAAHGKPDIIHAHNFEAGYLARFVRKKHGVRYVITEHSSRFLDSGPPPPLVDVALRAYKSSSYTLAVTPAFAEVMTAFAGRTFEAVPNVVDVDHFRPRKRPVGAPQFVSVGSLIPNKNQILQLEAFALVRRTHPDATLVIAGEGPDRRKLERRAQQTDLRGSVQLVGTTDRDETRDLMRSSSVHLISSLRETFGVVAIEALACGVPVVTTPCIGPEAIVTDARLGRVSGWTADQFADDIRALVDDQNHSQWRHDEISRRYSGEAVAKELTAIYECAISSERL